MRCDGQGKWHEIQILMILMLAGWLDQDAAHEIHDVFMKGVGKKAAS